MSSYHDKFIYKGVSNQDKNLIVASFSPDSGNADSFLSMESIYTDKYDGSMRYEYGAKYNTVTTFAITLINSDYTDITLSQFRSIAAWLTGAKLSSWLDFYKKDNTGAYQPSYSFLCKCINLEHYKMDSRTIGIIATFESVSPWAYSPVQQTVATISTSKTITITNNSDELYNYIYPEIKFENTTGSSLQITSAQTSEVTKVTHLVANETITMSSNQIITSDNAARIFGDDFNFIWLKLVPGANKLTVKGTGTITISYRYPMKVGDCAI